MPTVLRVAGFRFFFVSADCGEPAHIHVERDGRVAKVWLTPVRVATAASFRPRELRQIERIIVDNEQLLLDAWRAHCG